MIDHNPKHGASIEISSDRTKVWVNVDGRCVCRVIVEDATKLELNIPPFRPIKNKK